MIAAPVSVLLDRGFWIALAAALVLTPLVRRLAIRIGFVDAPREDRHHKKPTAYLGGLAVFLALAIGLVLSSRIDLDAGRLTLRTAHPYTLLLFIAATSFLLGLVDDVRHLAPPAKLTGQVLICAVFMGGAGPGPFHSPMIDAAIGAFWIIGLMNAFNFLDNMDGILSGVSLAVIAGFALVASVAGGGEIVAWLLPLAGALCGFLVFNFPPAKIFLGDAGSLLLGGSIAAAGWSLASLASRGVAAGGVPGDGGIGGIAPVWLALPLAVVYPIFDMTFVTITRLRRGQSPWVGGRDHTTHRLATWLGGGRRAAFAVSGLALAGSLAAWFVAGSSVGVGLAVFAGMVLVFVFIGGRLAKVKVA